MIRRVRIDFGYDGSRFAGSQRQANARTVQGDLERALKELCGAPVQLTLAGRTDRGVHAIGQVASGDVTWSRGDEALRMGLRALTPDDIVVYRVSPAGSGFNARYCARRREYRYRVWRGRRPPVLLRGLVWHVPHDLDAAAMSSVAAMLNGERDFRSFAGKGLGTPHASVSTVRQVFESEWRELPMDRNFEALPPGGQVLEYRVEANAFLPHMVRNLVGCMIEVGRGSRSVSEFQELLERRDRREAPPPAPPHGLVLWRVEYDDSGNVIQSAE